MPAGFEPISIDKYAIFHTAYGNAAVNWISWLSSCGYLLGYIAFFPKDQVPESTVVSGPFSFSFSLAYEIDRYQDVIETLRYEKPICVFIWWDANNVITEGYVATYQELSMSKKERVCHRPR